MRVKAFEFNPLGVNTYVLHDETKEGVVIDAACFYPDKKEELFRYINDQGIAVKHLLNTHLHFDHLFGVNMLSSHFGLTLSCHPGDTYLLDDLPRQLQQFGLPPMDAELKPEIGRFLNEGNTVTFGNQTLEIFHVPGHSPGSIAFYSAPNGYLFGGDVLFHSSIGRTDLHGGSYEALVNGIREKLFVLSNETVVYPGHGPSTTIGYEKKNNPFVGNSR